MTENNFSPPFGIENTMELAGTEILNSILDTETVTSSPDDVSLKDDEKPKKEEKKKDTVKEEPKKEEEISTEEILDKVLGDEEEEEEEQEEEEPKKETKVKDKPKKEEVNQFSALSKDLLDLGVFSEEEGEELNISTPEEFRDRFLSEKKKGAIQMVNDFIGQFGEEHQSAFDAIFVKGVNPRDYYSAYNNIQNFSEMDLNNKANQVSVIKQTLQDQGFDQEDITTELERLENYGDLEKVAERYHKVLVKKEAQKLQNLEIQKQQELQQKQVLKQQYVENVQSLLQEKLKTKEFDGIPINPKLVTEIQDYLLVDKYKTKSGETLTEFDKAILDLKKPENHERKVKIGLLLKILEKDPSLSTIQKTGVSKKAEGLFNELARQKKTTTTKKEQEPVSWWTN